MERLSEEEMLVKLSLANAAVEVDCNYTHEKSGTVYIVADFVFREADMSLMVTYYSPDQADIVFARPLEEFLDRFKKQ